MYAPSIKKSQKAHKQARNGKYGGQAYTVSVNSEHILSSLAGTDLTIYRQNQKLRLENKRLLQEIELVSNKNINLLLALREAEQTVKNLKSRNQHLEKLVRQLTSRHQIRSYSDRPLNSDNDGMDSSDSPYAILLRHLATPLGTMADKLLAQIYQRLKLSPTTVKVTDLKRVFSHLEKIAPKLVDPDQLNTLAHALTESRKLLLPAGHSQHSTSVSNPPRTNLEAALCEGHQLLQSGKPVEALEIFSRLKQLEPADLNVNLGYFLALVANRQWFEASVIGTALKGRLNKADITEEQAKVFKDALCLVLKEQLRERNTAAERKKILLELTELHLDEPKKALPFLRQAEILPDRIPQEGKIYLYLSRLLPEHHPDKLTYYLKALQELPGETSLMEELKSIKPFFKLANQRKTADIILRLYNTPITKLENITPSSNPFTKIENKLKSNNYLSAPDYTIRFCLDTLLPRAGLTPIDTDTTFVSRLQDSSEALLTDVIPELISKASHLLNLDDVHIRIYEGPDTSFWLDAARSDKPILIYHPKLTTLNTGEQLFLIYRTLIQLKHRHLTLYRTAASLTTSSRYRLARTYTNLFLRAGAPINDELIKQLTSLPGDTTSFNKNLSSILDALQKATGSDTFADLKEFLLSPQPFSEQLDSAADYYASLVSGIEAASIALARAYIIDPNIIEQLEKIGFKALFSGTDSLTSKPQHVINVRLLLGRLQRLWAVHLEEG